MNDNTEELLPCPLPSCGGEARLISNTPKYGNHSHSVLCTKCGCEIKHENWNERNDMLPALLKAWNTRPQNNVGECLKEIEEMYGYIELNIRTCNEVNTPQSKAVGKSYEAINKRLTKLQNLLGGA